MYNVIKVDMQMNVEMTNKTGDNQMSYSENATNPAVELATRLTESAVKNTWSAISDKINAVKAKKQDKETINQLEEIISSLLADKSELIRIAREYEELLQMQKISNDDIEYITNNWLPIFQKFAEFNAKSNPDKNDEMNVLIEILKPILSVETFTIFQLLGFNFKEAIGVPLTSLLRKTLETAGTQRNVIYEQLITQNKQLFQILQLLENKEMYRKFIEVRKQV